MSEMSPNLLDLDRFGVEVKRIEKPWGYELVFAATERYCGKVIFVRAGEQLSLQFHREKDETIFVHSGRADLCRYIVSPSIGPIAGEGLTLHA